MKEIRVLACAFTCCPSDKPGFTGGEDVLGWNMLQQIARFHPVWAITHAEDRASIEEELNEEPNPNMHFCYVGMPRWMSPFLRFQGTHQIYYHLWQLKAYLAARKLHGQVEFQLFHHVTYANDWLASFIGAFLPVPYIRGPGGGAHRTPKGFYKEYPLGGRIWEKVRSAGQWVFRHDPLFVLGQERAKSILVCNNDSEAKIPVKWRRKVHSFPVSGVSSEDLAVQPSGVTDGRFRILTAGSLLRIKGFGLAIKAFQEFSQRHQDVQFRIIGSGPEEPRLKAIAENSVRFGELEFVGAMSHRQLLGEMAEADVFLFPSLRDGGGTVVIEAMSAGKPVVCLDTGGPGTHITEECGIKVDATTPEQATTDLAEALERLYQNPDLREKLGRSAKARAEQLYHWDKLGERLMEIYQRAL